MNKTATEVRVKKPTLTKNRTIRNTKAAFVYEERHWYSRPWFLISAPIALASISCATFFTVRYLLNDDERDERLI